MESHSLPIRVAFHGVERSESLEELVEAQVSRLTLFHPRIHRVDVVLMRSDRWRVEVRVAIPGHDVVVRHPHARHADDEDPFSCIREAFRALERRLTESAWVRRGQVKGRAVEAD